MNLKYWAPLIFTSLISSHAVAENFQAKKANEDIMVCQYKAAIELD